MHYQLETIHGVLGEKFMVEIVNSFYRTFSYALLSTAGVARRLMACSLVPFPAVYSYRVDLHTATREHTSNILGFYLFFIKSVKPSNNNTKVRD